MDKYAVYWDQLNLDQCFLEALQPKVNITDGGLIWIEKTKAATLIDIDTQKLIFNTDNVGSTSGAIDLGQFQIVPIAGGTNASSSVTIAGGSSATISTANLGVGNLLFGDFTSAPVGDVNTSQTVNGAYTGTTSGSLTNTGSTSLTLTVSVIKGFSTASLF